jgi:hypothetical protein
VTRSELLFLICSSSLTALTGTVYGIMKYFMVSSDPFAVINHPWQPIFLKLHIVTAPLMVFAVGMVFRRHVIDRWRAGSPRGRRSGAMITGLFTPLVLTGYLIQVVTGGVLLQGLVLSHLLTAGAFLAGMGMHRRRSIVLFPQSVRGNLRPAAEPCRESSWRDRSST